MGGKKLPPGPKGWPIFGNAFDLLEGKGFYVPVLRQWAKEYGSIVLFRIGAQKHVIISDDKAAQELFSKRGTKYADRYVTHAIGWTTMNQNPALRPRDGKHLKSLCSGHAPATRAFEPLLIKWDEQMGGVESVVLFTTLCQLRQMTNTIQ